MTHSKSVEGWDRLSRRDRRSLASYAREKAFEVGKLLASGTPEAEALAASPNGPIGRLLFEPGLRDALGDRTQGLSGPRLFRAYADAEVLRHVNDAAAEVAGRLESMVLATRHHPSSSRCVEGRRREGARRRLRPQHRDHGLRV